MSIPDIEGTDGGKNENAAENETKSCEYKECAARIWRTVGSRIGAIIRFLKSIDSLIVAIATVILAWIAYWQYSALNSTDKTLRETLVAANRAWIAPAGMDVTGEISGDKDISVAIYFTNIGKSPALNLNEAFVAGTVPTQDKSDLVPIDPGPNNTCQHLLPKPEGKATFPDPTAHQWTNTKIYRNLILPAVQTGDGALFIVGCFTYETMHEVRFTWFCYSAFRNGKFANIRATDDCKGGHGAD